MQNHLTLFLRVLKKSRLFAFINLAGPILVALILSTPFAFLIINYGLQNFTYHITVRPIIFLASSLILMAIAFLTVSLLVKRTSSLNPVDILKNE
jgi:putative ABC transport system permease protein